MEFKMWISKVKINNFRNYKEQEIELGKNVNVFYGENAQGKTNIIEAIFLCSMGKSFRAKQDKEMIKLGGQNAIVEIEFQKKDREGKIKIQLGNKKIVYVNGIKVKKLSDLLGNLNVVMFNPDDINILKGGPQNRRRFLDIMISQLKPNYMHTLSSYSKTIEPYREFVRERGKKEISESREYNDVLNKIGKTKENEELLNEIFINGKLFVPIKNANRPRIFYTIENGGVLDYAMLHEFCHVIEIQIENGKGVGSGFDNSEEKNLYREEKRKYERLNENITDIFAIEATRILHNRGVYMLEPKELIVNDVWDINTDSITKKMLIPFLEDYKKEIVKARITGDMEGLLNIIGKDNFEELNDCINKVDYLIQKGLKRRLDKNEKNDELIEEYQKELERLDIIYSKMEEYSLEEER